jgi:beta propeller repeat protein
MIPLTRPFQLFAARALASLALLCLAPASLPGQQQFQGTCARVKIEILQTLTTERIGFEATLEITNNESEEALTDFSAELTFESESAEDGIQDASHLFFVRQPTLTNINRIDGTGVVSPTQTAVVRWFIIPKPTAGGTKPNGIFYRVGCKLGGKMAGVDIPQEDILVIPDTIQVRPEPRLTINYFQPRDVQGDDPFTDEVESPIPFTLGVLVQNTGYATARNVQIESQQPRIVENKQGLLLVAQLLGARVQDSDLDETSLTVVLGDIPPGEARKGAWDMITSLSGEFVEFKATYTHAAELGGEETSLIESLDAHFIAAEVLNDEPGRDSILDFLADTDRDEDMIPDALYESNGNVLPVNHVIDAEVVSPLQGREFVVRVRPAIEGWGYSRLDDPGQAKYGIEKVIRSDGKRLSLHNIWTNIRYDRNTNAKLTYLNIFDRYDIGEYTYTVTYAPPPADTEPPQTRLRFAGEVVREGDNHYITRDTQMYFTSEDASPVSIFYKVNNGPFVPALPFKFSEPGTYDVIYYAEDAAGNVETESFARLIIPGGGPGFDMIETAREALFLKGDVLSARPDAAVIDFTVGQSPTQVDAMVEVFAGVRAFPRVSGLPPSPSPLSAVDLAVGGDYVDFYKYRLNGGAWSAETPVAAPLSLSGLSGGVELEVLGRSQHGAWPESAQALQFSWQVNPTVTEARLDGMPGQPVTSAFLDPALDGPGFAQYRWTIGGGFYRAPLAAGEAFTLDALTPGPHILAFNTDADGSLDSDPELQFPFVVDPQYGSGFDGLPLVYSELLEDVAGAAQSFVWDGRDDAGIQQPPGWYTVRIGLSDPIGQSGFTTRLVRIEDLSGQTALLAAKAATPRNLKVRKGVAVWQERIGTDWDIVALDLTDPDALPAPLTDDHINQQRPHTDGRWVVWQVYRDSNFDIEALDLADPGAGIQSVTTTAGFNETSPVVDWPWVVYQRQAVGDSSAPQLLVAHNLDDGSSFNVSPSTQDQLFADIHAGRVVWQDFRDVGNGEIYLADLETGEQRRLTNSVFGQFFPSIRGDIVVWQDNRNTQVDIYGFDLLAGREFRVTDTPHNEAHPVLLDRFVVYDEDSMGPGTAKLRIHDLDTGLSVPLTRDRAFNRHGGEAGGFLLWLRSTGPADPVFELLSAPIPALQLIAGNYNAVPVTPALAQHYPDAYAVLDDWRVRAGVSEVARFTELSPAPVRESAVWDDLADAASGANFPLTAGDFLWIRFADSVALDLGDADEAPVALQAGLNVLAYTGFPSEYSAYELLEGIGIDNVSAVRMLDARAGLWQAAVVDSGRVLGPNFRIPVTAVLIIEMTQPVAEWDPRRNPVTP